MRVPASLMVGAAMEGEETGAVYVFKEDGSAWRAVQKLIPPELEPGDRFGTSLVLDGSVALVSAPNQKFGRGAVYSFVVNERGVWDAAGMLRTDGVGETDHFGSALELRLPYALVGVPRHDRSTGAVFTFMRDGESSTWTTGPTLRPFDALVQTRFGTSVALSPSEEGPVSVWVGAPGSSRMRGGVYRSLRHG